MLKILIVDDIENNRLLLRALLEDYAQENQHIEISLTEAANGIEAVALATEDGYDLIFMDIMMPEMDGIEATRRIRLHDPKVMLIAVSAIDDSERQKEILRNGAEDYILKPVNIEIFRARLSTYFALIHSRHGVHKRFNPMPANLFSKEIYSRKFLFYVQNSDELAEFWEYYLLNHENGSEELSAAVRTFYAIGSIGMKLDGKFQVITEEGDTFSYMTLVGIDQIDPKIIKLILMKNSDVTDYKLDESKLSIRIPIEQKFSANLATQPVEPQKSPVYENVTNTQISPEVYTAQEEVIQVYDYMDEEDLAEIKEYIAKLDSLMLLVGRGDIHSYELQEIAHNLERISKIASLYSDSYVIGRALNTLSDDIRSHIDVFLEKSSALGPLCAAFSRDLSNWIRIVFEEGATSVNYMDDTISSNAQMIAGILKMDESSEEAMDLDDIFDF